METDSGQDGHTFGRPGLIQSEQRCKNCQFRGVVNHGRGASSVCRFNPPALVPIQMHNPGHALDRNQPQIVQGFQGVFVPIDDGMWCGKWQLKTEGSA